MSRIYDDNSLAIGNTPLVKLNSVTKNCKATVLAKVEGRNPAYSVKCRIGANMIWDAEKSGKLTKDKVIVEPTSGNTGIALAFTAAARGYKLILTMPESMSIERRRMMAVLGAELILTEAAKGMPGAIAKAKEIADSDPGKYFMPGQFDNPANPDIHFKTTGPEIWNDCDGAIDVLVAGVGTGGTITGVSRYIKNEAGKAIESVAVEPSHSPVITQTINGETVKPRPPQDPGHRRRLHPQEPGHVHGRQGGAGDQWTSRSPWPCAWPRKRAFWLASPVEPPPRLPSAWQSRTPTPAKPSWWCCPTWPSATSLQ